MLNVKFEINTFNFRSIHVGITSELLEYLHSFLHGFAKVNCHDAVRSCRSCNSTNNDSHKDCMFGNDVVLHQEFDGFVGLRSFSSRFAGNLVQHLAEEVLHKRSHKSQDPLVLWWSIDERRAKDSISPYKEDEDKDLAQKPCIPSCQIQIHQEWSWTIWNRKEITHFCLLSSSAMS